MRAPFWTFLYAIKVFGIAEEIPDWLDLRVQYREFKEAGALTERFERRQRGEHEQK